MIEFFSVCFVLRSHLWCYDWNREWFPDFVLCLIFQLSHRWLFCRSFMISFINPSESFFSLLYQLFKNASPWFPIVDSSSGLKDVSELPVYYCLLYNIHSIRYTRCLLLRLRLLYILKVSCVTVLLKVFADCVCV